MLLFIVEQGIPKLFISLAPLEIKQFSQECNGMTQGHSAVFQYSGWPVIEHMPEFLPEFHGIFLRITAGTPFTLFQAEVIRVTIKIVPDHAAFFRTRKVFFLEHEKGKNTC